jgi:hypothetical protein
VSSFGGKNVGAGGNFRRSGHRRAGCWESDAPGVGVIPILRCNGTWRSLVAHLLWEQGVVGSNPAVPMFVPRVTAAQ